MDGAIDPLSVTARSIRVTREDGRALPARLWTAGSSLHVDLELDPESIADRPSSVRVRLTGYPAVHGVALLDGRHLARTASVVFDVERDLDPLGAGPIRLASVAGSRLPPSQPVRVAGELVLVFDGVLDPASLVPENCALWPKQSGLVLGSPLLPEVGWRCIGRRFELRLGLGDAAGLFELDVRRLGILGLSGERPEPPLKVECLVEPASAGREIR